MDKVQDTLRAENPAVKRELERLKKASRDFEQVFVKIMLKEMHKNIKGGMLDGGKYQEMFKGMLMDERAKAMVDSGQFGLAEQMYEQLEPTVLSQSGVNPDPTLPAGGRSLDEMYHQVNIERIAHENRRTSGDQE